MHKAKNAKPRNANEDNGTALLATCLIPSARAFGVFARSWMMDLFVNSVITSLASSNSILSDDPNSQELSLSRLDSSL